MPRWNDLPVPPLTPAEISAREALHTQQRHFTLALLPQENARRDMVNAFTFVTKDVSNWVGVCCCNSVSHPDSEHAPSHISTCRELSVRCRAMVVLFIFPRLGLDFNMLAHVLKFAGRRQYTPYQSYGRSPIYALREAFTMLFHEDMGDNLAAPMLASHGFGFLVHPSPMFEDACTSHIV